MEDWSMLRKLLFHRGALGEPIKEYEVTGNPAKFNTNIAKPLSGFTVPFLPVQAGSGDPSPVNQRNIYGWTGVTGYRTGGNVLNAVAENLLRFTESGYDNYTFNNGVITINGTSLFGFKVPVKPSTKYAWSFDTTANVTVEGFDYTSEPTKINNSDHLFYYRGNSTGGDVLTTPADCTWIAFAISTSAVGTVIKDFQLNVGESPSPYSAYTGESYPCVFPAVGKNLFDKNNKFVATIYLEATTGVAKQLGQLSSRCIRMPCKPSTTYTISNGITTTLRVSSFDSIAQWNQAPTATNSPENATTAGTGLTITTGANDEYLYIQVFANADTGVDIDTGTASLMVNEGSTALPYEPYTNTIYGGTIDWVNRVVEVEWALIDLYEKRSYIQYNSGFGLFTLPPKTSGDEEAKGNFKCLCNAYKYGGAYNKLQDQQIGYIFSNQIAIRDDSFAGNLSDFRDSLEGIVCVYEIDTPITIPLSSLSIPVTLKGDDTTIWTNTNGSNTIKYKKKG